MARPRTSDLDVLLDVAETIATRSGTDGLTLRRLATEAGVSNGSIYHAFSSKEEILARVWIRAARRLLSVQQARVATAIQTAPAGASGTEAVVAAALWPVEFAIAHPAGARLFFGHRRDQLFSDELPLAIIEELAAVQSDFTDLLITLARACWDRGDRVAVEAITTCVVDLPGGLMQRRLSEGTDLDETTSRQIEAACRALLSLELPPPPARTTPTTTSRNSSRD